MPQLFELSLVTFLWFVPSLDMLVGRFFYFLQICYYHFPSTALLLLLLLLLHGNQKNKNWHVPRNQRTTCRESIGEPSDEAKTDGSKRQRVFFNHHRQSEIAGCEKSWGDFFFLSVYGYIFYRDKDTAITLNSHCYHFRGALGKQE